MQESSIFFHQLEWPAPGATVAGPVVWLRGWVVGKPDYDFVDIRVTGTSGVHLGVLGFPRTDLAAHFKSARPWLPAEYIIGVSLPNGSAELAVEAMDEYGNWHRLQLLTLTVAHGGQSSPRIEGEVAAIPGGSATVRVPHLPFHGHLDDPTFQPSVRDGRVELFGWLLHEAQPVRAVFATLDGLVFNEMASGLTDESLATKVPQHAAARFARVRGGIDAPVTLTSPACLRVYAELADGSVHLCFARRISPQRAEGVPTGPRTIMSPANREGAALPLLPSGRPRRLLMVVRSLQADDATLRALDVVHHLITSTRWAVRLVASEDGPLQSDFEASGCAVQIVDPRAYFAATDASAAETALNNIERQIWWKHLDAVAVFDPASTWAGKLARQKAIPVFDDPADALVWYSPTPVFTVDSQAALVAPIRGLAAQGAGVLLHAIDQLARHHATVWDKRLLRVTDVRGTLEEDLFRASISRSAARSPCLSQTDSPAGGQPPPVAAVICPAFSGHPHRTLLSALAAGVPLITTVSPELSATFGPHEIHFVPPGNPLALAHAMADVLSNPVANQRRATAAMRLLAANHAPNGQLARWQAGLEACVAG